MSSSLMCSPQRDGLGASGALDVTPFAALSHQQMQWPYHLDSSILCDRLAIWLVLIIIDLKKVILQCLLLLSPTAKRSFYLETLTFRVFFSLVSIRFLKYNLKMSSGCKLLLSFQSTALNIWGDSNSRRMRTELELKW